MTRRLLTCITILGAIACEPPTIGGPYVGLHVQGTVRAPGGEPVVGATLEVRARSLETCTGTFADATPTTSDAGGAFARTLGTWNVPRDVCIWIDVLPPSATGVAPRTITVKPARLDLVLDTLVVDIVLPAAP